MNFGKIAITGDEIMLEQWNSVISNQEFLEQAPDRKGVNPFTEKEEVFPGEGIAFYTENGDRAGNIVLQDGVLLTSGVPMAVCLELASIFGAIVSEEDRS
jgi:hypothetical protein